MSKIAVEDSKNRLQSEILQNDVLKRQVKDLEMQLELSNAKINVSSLENPKHRNQFLTYY
jgi:hypothetical protein